MADIPGNLTTNATIGIGGTVDNAIEAVGDHDWFKIALTAGQKVVIALNVVTLQDPYVYIRDSSGTLLGENDDGGGGRGSRLVFTAPTSGTYYIDVAAWAAPEPLEGYTGTGTYRLSVNNYVDPPVGTLDEIAHQMTHGFFAGNVHHFDVRQGGTISVDLTAITASGRAVALRALQQWSDIIGVDFVEKSGGAQITFDDLQQGTGAFANAIHSNGIISSAIVNVSLQRLNLHTYMHEIGHALGLGHTSNSNAGTAGAIYPNDALWSNDGAAISIMSYFDNAENAYYASRGFSHLPILTPQVADIIAIGNLYGLSTATRPGNTTYGFNNTSGNVTFDATVHPNVAYAIYDAGGIDTLDYSGFANNQMIDLNAEAFSNVGAGVGNVVIARGTLIEEAIGGSGADRLVGNNADNRLTGRGGADTLTGGLGSDIFAGTGADLNGDTITDFSGNDRIIISDGEVTSLSYSQSNSLLTFSGGSLTLLGFSGQLRASALVGGGVQLTVEVPPPETHRAGDFNGDGHADILWRNSNGTLTNWLGQADGGFAGNYFAGALSLPAGWTVQETGDFNGDGRSDVLWRHTNGTVTNWLAQPNGSFAGNYENAAYSVDMNWRVAGTGDYNGDDRDDVLWRKLDGSVVTWSGNANGSFTASASSYQPGEGWYVTGTGDFNGDGRADILWRHTNGTLTNWLGQADGSFLGNYEAGVLSLENAWKVVGTGDFNGDGRDDVLWLNDNGVLTNWLAQSNGNFAGNYLNAAYQIDGRWQVALTGDVGGDGRDDIIWRDESGAVFHWVANADGSFVTSGVPPISIDASWQVTPGTLFLG